MARHSLIVEDCATALGQTEGLWSAVAGRRLFVTGGTGFFGTWFLELMTYAADELGFECEAVVLTRDSEAYRRGPAGHLAQHRCVSLLQGDVRDFAFPEASFDHVAHFGSTGSRKFQDGDPVGFRDLIVNGTRRVLDFAVHAGATRMLLASTGAVYGGGARGPLEEDGLCAPDALSVLSPNAQGKRTAESLALAMSRRRASLEVAIARGFAFIGPYLPTEANFAAYEFVQDALAGRPIRICGDGTPRRSYLYASDLAVWLWTLLLRAPANTAWNVGAERVVTIRELAGMIAAIGGSPAVHVEREAAPGVPESWYVPATKKARDQLGLRETVTLEHAVERTLAWYASVSGPNARRQLGFAGVRSCPSGAVAPVNEIPGIPS